MSVCDGWSLLGRGLRCWSFPVWNNGHCPRMAMCALATQLYICILYVVCMEAYSDGRVETIVHRMCVSVLRCVTPPCDNTGSSCTCSQ